MPTARTPRSVPLIQVETAAVAAPKAETQAEAAQLLAKSQLERKDEETQELDRNVAQLEEHVATTKRLEADTASDRSNQHAEPPPHTSSTSPCMPSTSKHIFLLSLLFLPHCVVFPYSLVLRSIGLGYY